MAELKTRPKLDYSDAECRKPGDVGIVTRDITGALLGEPLYVLRTGPHPRSVMAKTARGWKAVFDPANQKAVMGMIAQEETIRLRAVANAEEAAKRVDAFLKLSPADQAKLLAGK